MRPLFRKKSRLRPTIVPNKAEPFGQVPSHVKDRDAKSGHAPAPPAVPTNEWDAESEWITRFGGPFAG